jgi:hypothetical protein
MEWFRRDEVRRSSRRTESVPTLPNVYQKGGRIALYLLELQEEDICATAKGSTAKEQQSQEGATHTEPMIEGKTSAASAPRATGLADKSLQEPPAAAATTTEATETKLPAQKMRHDHSTLNGTTDAEATALQGEHATDPSAEEAPNVDGNNEDPVADDKRENEPREEAPLVSDDGNKGEEHGDKNEIEADSKVSAEEKQDTEDKDVEAVVYINAHEEELESEEDEADRDDDFNSKDGMEDEEEDDDVLEDVIKEREQLDIEMEGNKPAMDQDEENEEEEDDDEDGNYVSDNPFLQPTPETILDWIGRRGKSLGIPEIQEAVGVCLKSNLALYDLTQIDQRVLGTKGESFVLDTLEKWKDLKKYDAATFNRCKFRLRSDTEAEQQWFLQQELDERHRKEKAWASWRFKGVHGGFTVWPSWIESVEGVVKAKAKKNQGPYPEIEEAAKEATEEDDMALAQSLALSSGRRSTRRANTADGGVFYGSQSQMTQKQLMEAVHRICSQSTCHTLVGLQALVGDESTNPIHRLRTTLGRLIWKRNQLSRVRVTSIWSDEPLWTSLKSAPLWTGDEELDVLDQEAANCVSALARYIQHLHQTELQLRSILVRQLTHTPVSTIATSADERTGTLESFDAADFEDPENIEWSSSGHHFIGKKIFRPSEQPAFDTSDCRWYSIKDYVESVHLDDAGEEKSEQGALLVERRMRFRASPITDDGEEDYGNLLVLTEAQVVAGIKASEIEMEIKEKSSSPEHPFAGGIGMKVTLRSPKDEKHTYIVGFDTWLEGNGSTKRQHKAYLLPEACGDAFWTTLGSDTDGHLICTIDDAIDSTVYKVEQSDYEMDSPAHRACQSVVDYLSKHKNASIFMDPVDPVALNIPTYFDIVQRPMDISTLSDNLEKGLYSKIPPGKSIGRSATSRMLNGPFKDDALLIFDNAITFNPPDDWIHQAAKSIRKTLIKKIEQASNEADASDGGRRPAYRSLYVDEDSDVDMYEYESDRDDDDFTSGRAKKRKRKAGTQKEDISIKAIEGPVKLQTTLSETLGLRGPFSSLPIISDANGFSIDSQWQCSFQTAEESGEEKMQDNKVDAEIEEILELQRHAEESERAVLRRSHRSHYTYDSSGPKRGSSKAVNLKLTYHLKEALPGITRIVEPPDMTAKDRVGVETVLEQVHETYYARLYQQLAKHLSSESKYGSFAGASFPPYLGRVVPSSLEGEDLSWEIRSDYVVPAVRWILRGLIQSGHLTEIEPLTLDAPHTSGMVMTSDVYFCDHSQRPFDLLELRRKKKDEGEGDSSEDEIELSEYEKLRAERVARNAERLKMLGLA